MKCKSNLLNAQAPRLAHFVRAFLALFIGRIGGKPWHKHLYRWWRSLLGDPRFLLTAFDTNEAVHAVNHFLSNKISALTAETARLRNINNSTVLRHLSELGTPGPAKISYKLDHVTRSIDPLIIRRSDRVCVISLALGSEYRKMIGSCLRSQSDYCERHGYSLLELGHATPSTRRPAAWLKIPLALRALQMGFEQIFYIDADCMITNPDITLSDHFARWDSSNPTSSMLITEDEGGINSGCFFLKNTPDSFRLMDSIWMYDAEPKQATWEQQAFKRLLQDHEAFNSLLYIDPEPRNFNSFPHERLAFVQHVDLQFNTWQQGDFICHFSGVRKPHLKRLIEHYETELQHN
jgi:galactosyl transferase GMA12/MNN10 family